MLFQVHGGGWVIALTADDTGVDLAYPELVSLTEDELGSLAPILKDITRETWIDVRAARAVHACWSES